MTDEGTVEFTAEEGEKKPPTPTSLNVIGWTFVSLGALMIVTSAMVVFVFSAIKNMDASMDSEVRALMDEALGDFGVTLDLTLDMLSHVHSLAVVNIILAVIIIFFAVQFLRLKPWARTALEAITWLAVVATVVYGTYWIKGWLSVTSAADAAASGHYGSFGVAVAAAAILVNLVPAAIIIRYLRGQVVRDALS